MPRKREVKPDFFTHPELYEADKAGGFGGLLRLAYVGLWCCCDREGRFEWKPRVLKLDCLPHDLIEFSEILDGLHAAGFVVRYVVDGKHYGAIPTFKLHQRIHPQEARSKLPAATESNTISVDHRRLVTNGGESRPSSSSLSGPSGPSISSDKKEGPDGPEQHSPRSASIGESVELITSRFNRGAA